MPFDILPNLALLAGRCLIAVLFLGASVQKLVAPIAVRSLLDQNGLPADLIWPALGFNAAAGVMLVAGIGVRPISVLLAAYCGVTSFFHLIPDDAWQMTIFVKNWSIAGGCLALAVAGSGRLALRPDRALRTEQVQDAR